MIDARLSKDRNFIICGRLLPGGHPCGERLAAVDWWPGERPWHLPAAAIPLGFAMDEAESQRMFPASPTAGVDETRRIVAATLPSGFVLDEAQQVWRLSNHARKRWERDRAAAAQGDRAAAERLCTGQSQRSRRPRLVDVPSWLAVATFAQVHPDLVPRRDATARDLQEHAGEAAQRARAAGRDPRPALAVIKPAMTLTTNEALASARRLGFDPARLDPRRIDFPLNESAARYAWPAQHGRAIVCPVCHAINRLAAIADRAGFVR